MKTLKTKASDYSKGVLETTSIYNHPDLFETVNEYLCPGTFEEFKKRSTFSQSNIEAFRRIFGKESFT